jgi:6-pyruvoyltetrahydropterin/6-carboxytetrahydropterin synthase
MRTTVFRKEHLNSAHRLHNDSLSNEENELTFGKCNNPNYHGHHYTLIVKVIGEINSKTEYVIDMKLLGEVIKQNIIERFDHKYPNLDTTEFKNLKPTAENITTVAYSILRSKTSGQYDLKITLHETERNYVEYPA